MSIYVQDVVCVVRAVATLLEMPKQIQGRVLAYPLKTRKPFVASSVNGDTKKSQMFAKRIHFQIWTAANAIENWRKLKQAGKREINYE